MKQARASYEWVNGGKLGIRPRIIPTMHTFEAVADSSPMQGPFPKSDQPSTGSCWFHPTSRVAERALVLSNLFEENSGTAALGPLANEVLPGTR